MKAAHPTTRLLAFGLGLAVLLGVVAFAVRGHTAPASGDAHNRSASHALSSVVFTLWALAMAAGAVLLAYVLAQKRRQKSTSTFRMRSALVSLLIFAAIFGLLVGAQRHWGGGAVKKSPGAAQVNKVQKALTKAERKRQATRPQPPTFEWRLALGILALVAGVAATAVIRSWRKRKELIGELTLAQKLTEMLDDTLEDLRREADPRKAVIAAYARMERILGAHGVPRKPSEAPLEYLSRVLVGLQVTESAVRRLTRLFERAKFSQHDVDASMKEQAIDALVSIRDDLKRPEEPEPAAVQLDDAPRPAT